MSPNWIVSIKVTINPKNGKDNNMLSVVNNFMIKL